MVDWQTQQPVRVVVDSKQQLRLESCKIVTDGLPTIIVHDIYPEECNNDGFLMKRHVKYSNGILLGISANITSVSGASRLSAKAVVNVLQQACNLQHIMVERGPNTALQFLAEKLVDRVILVNAPMTFQEPLHSKSTHQTLQEAGLKKIGSYILGVDSVDCLSHPHLPWPSYTKVSDWP